LPRSSRTTVPTYEPSVATAVVHKPHPHDSARLHVSGAAAYVDDIREPQGTLHLAVGMGDKAHGRLRSLDLAAVRAAPGVVAVLAAADIPGKNDIAPVFADEPLLAFDEILFHGQALFVVAATTRDAARRAARLAKIDIEEKTPALTVDDALAGGLRVQEDYAYGRGDVQRALAAAPHRLEGVLGVGGQEHFYLEGQASLAVPGEAGEMTLYTSTQDPTEVQHIVGRVLGLPDAFVTVETRRMGGGFGGKESQACAWAALAALAARATGRPSSSDSIATMISSSPASATISATTGRSATTTRAASPPTTWCSTRAAAARPTFRPASSTARCSTPPIATGCPTFTFTRGG